MADPVALPQHHRDALPRRVRHLRPRHRQLHPQVRAHHLCGQGRPRRQRQHRRSHAGDHLRLPDSNTNIPGGRIRIYPASSTSPELCMDAGTATPSAGALVKLQAVREPAARTSRSSPTAATSPFSCCPRSRAPIPTACAWTPHRRRPRDARSFVGACSARRVTAVHPAVELQRQRRLHGLAADVGQHRRRSRSQCISVANQGAGTQVTLAACSGGGTSSPTQAWIPAPAVGAGAAEAPQLINYYEFGRCLDVTSQNVNSNHLIDFPCKQNPFSGAVAWNQKFTTPGIAAGATSATGQIYTATGGTNYCLTSPGTDGGYVTVQACSGINSPAGLDRLQRQLGAALHDQVHDRRQRGQVPGPQRARVGRAVVQHRRRGLHRRHPAEVERHDQPVGLGLPGHQRAADRRVR